MKFSGEKLQACREQSYSSRHKAVMALARNTGVEVTETAWANWEKGKNSPGADMLPALAALFGVDMAYFFAPACGHEDTAPPMEAA